MLKGKLSGFINFSVNGLTIQVLNSFAKSVRLMWPAELSTVVSATGVSVVSIIIVAGLITVSESLIISIFSE